MLHVVTLVNTISVTSMPINEFVLYRANSHMNIKQTVVFCDGKTRNNVLIPDSIAVYCCNNSVIQMRNILKKIMVTNRKDQIIFHAHQDRVGLIFLMGSIFLNVRKNSLFTLHNTLRDRTIKDKITLSICALLFNYVTCVSKSSYGALPEWIKKIKPGKVSPIVNGVDIERIERAISDIKKDYERSDSKMLVCVARMVPIKNHKFLVDLMTLLPKHRLVLIGLEDKEQSIRKYAIEKQVLNRIDILGMLDRDEVFRCLKKARIYVSASLTEGLPVSVLEAMTVGLIPVISDIAPHQEIAHCCDKVYVLPLDINQWKEKIEKISNFDENDVITYQASIRESVVHHFSLQSMHHQYNELYQKLREQ